MCSSKRGELMIRSWEFKGFFFQKFEVEGEQIWLLNEFVAVPLDYDVKLREAVLEPWCLHKLCKILHFQTSTQWQAYEQNCKSIMIIDYKIEMISSEI